MTITTNTITIPKVITLTILATDMTPLKGFLFPLPPSKPPLKPSSKDKAPYSTTLIKTVNSQPLDRPLLALFDTGSTKTWIKKSALPPNVNGYTLPTVSSQTMAGKFQSNQGVNLDHIILPEFDPSKTYDHLQAQLLFNECRYDIIFGCDALKLFSLVLDFDNNLMTTSNTIVPMHKLS